MGTTHGRSRRHLGQPPRRQILTPTAVFDRAQTNTPRVAHRARQRHAAPDPTTTTTTTTTDDDRPPVIGERVQPA